MKIWYILREEVESNVSENFCDRAGFTWGWCYAGFERVWGYWC